MAVKCIELSGIFCVFFTVFAMEGEEIMVNTFYNNDGILEFDKLVTFEPIGENVELIETQLIRCSSQSI